MADTSTFMAVGQVPQVDYGAVYRNAKARRELEEEKKLQYLNQFQQERGAFTTGMQDELQAEWDSIEQDLDQGDMSFEAKARRQRMYNNYKQHAADALEYANQINDLEASILADPNAYNDPAAVMAQLEDARNVQVSANNIGLAAGELPSINEFRRFSLPEIAPNAAAGMILENLKTSGGINNFYDMADSGQLSPEAVASSVTAWFNSNSLSQEEEDQAIAFVLHQLGGLSGSMDDLSKIRNLNDEEREDYIGQYAQYVTGALTNMLAEDVTTEREKRQQELSDYRTKSRIQAEEARAASQASGYGGFVVETGDLQYIPPIKDDDVTGFLGDNGKMVVKGDPGLANANMVIHASIEGTQPMYRDVNGNQNYIESIGINQDGKMVAIIRTNQKVVRNNKDATHVARTVVDASEIPLNGLSNAAQADKIRQTYNNMLPMWSANFAGRESQFGTEQEMANQLDVVIDNYEPAPTQNLDPVGCQPTSTARSIFEDFPAPTEPTIEITINEWSDMSKPAQRNFIMDEAVNRNSETIEFNGLQRRKWDTMTPTERKNELAKVRNELRLQLKIDI
jgi:hypothetical protein